MNVLSKGDLKKVLVIVVTYNGIQWIDKCLGSLEESSYPLSMTVIDNGSDDGTIENIKNNYTNVDLIITDQNLGFGKANNIGFKKALENNFEYVFLLNQDAWIEKDTIRTLVRVAERNKEYGIISPMHLNKEGTALDFIFSTYLESRKCPGLLSDIYLKQSREIYSLYSVNAAAWLVPCAVLKTVGYFDELFFMYGEDDNFADRINYHGYKIGVSPAARIFHDSTRKGGQLMQAKTDYATQLKRMKRIALNPNDAITGKYYYLFRKSMSDALLNLQSGNFGAILINMRILITGFYYIIRYHKRY